MIYEKHLSVTPEVLMKLEQAFAIGATDLEACFYANISKSTLYNYQKTNPEFLERKNELKQKPVLAARKVIVDAIDKDDREMAKWYIQRKRKGEFSTREETTGKGGKDLNPPTTIITTEDAAKAYVAAIKNANMAT